MVADLVNSFWTNPDAGSDNYGSDKHGVNTIDNNGDFSDSGGHGTHMSGIAAATTNNSVGVAGVGYNSKLCPCKFMSTSSGQLSNFNKCVEYAIANGIQVISMSFGGSTPLATTKTAIASASKAGIFMAASAGNSWQDNDSKPVYPASYSLDTDSALVSVGAYCQNQSLINYGSYAKKSVQIAAPGDYVLATGQNSAYEYRGGTSPAAPNIAGIGALMKSENTKLTGLEIKNIIKETVTPIAAFSGYNAWSGKANAASAVAKAKAKSG